LTVVEGNCLHSMTGLFVSCCSLTDQTLFPVGGLASHFQPNPHRKKSLACESRYALTTCSGLHTSMRALPPKFESLPLNGVDANQSDQSCTHELPAWLTSAPFHY